MSNIGKQPVEIPEGVDVTISGSNIHVKGSLGELNLNFDTMIEISKKDTKIVVKRSSDEKKCKEFC